MDKRYSRQILLKEFGPSAQNKLAKAKVLVIGVGGLGCPALQYLTAAGVGEIGIVDYDTVELSNLHRQVLYGVQDIGKSKVNTAARRLRELNPETTIQEYDLKITNQNALDIIGYYDIIVDGSDNFSTRYLVNDACVLLEKPLVYGAVYKFEGQVAVFNDNRMKKELRTNYRDLFSVPPVDSLGFSCEDVGVIGILPGIVGIMQATEVIKILTGIGNPLINKLLSYNAMENSYYEFNIALRNRSKQHVPYDETSYLEFNYELFCNTDLQFEIGIEKFRELLYTEDLFIIDVRELDELPEVNTFRVIKIPLSKWDLENKYLPEDKVIVLICQSGKRSLLTVNKLKKIRPNSEIYSLQGGLEELNK